jgi:hypothetical protein
VAHAHYSCWNCDADNRLYGDYCDCCDAVEVAEAWSCWDCGAENFTPEH